MNNTFRCPEHPDRLTSYFRQENDPLIIVTVTGIFYNVGLAAGPIMEGQLAK